ncbi:reverse transcriptase [Elysia marginata]|uniref:Reverse transcriptase n=1 Tax=Elysia marginata TaxID=1093978 RepID=A0AAV4GA82_9GAST|nr:reverse transcriptase [Elysia marginata]
MRAQLGGDKREPDYQYQSAVTQLEGDAAIVSSRFPLRLEDSRLRDYLKSSNLDTKFQSAYKKDHNTETTLLKVLNDALRAADAKQPTLLVLLDLSAAFDTIDHELLLSILELDYRFGINGAAIQWLRSYLTGRMQSVFIDGVSSPVSSLQFGVPQGSVLGPLLFTLYTSPVADIADCYDVKYHLYADDTQFYISLDADGQVQKKLVKDCVRDISKWMAVNKLKLNCDKTDVILLGSHRLLKDIDTRLGIIIDNCKVSSGNIKTAYLLRALQPWRAAACSRLWALPRRQRGTEPSAQRTHKGPHHGYTTEADLWLGWGRVE